MPDRRKLKVGDKIRIVSIPEDDIRQKEREIKNGVKDAGYTANTFELILEQNPIIEIKWIDEYGLPWFLVDIRTTDGSEEEHSIAIMDDDSWIYV